jgi:hypothetical protein
MHFEGFSGIGFGLVFMFLTLLAVAIGFFVLLAASVSHLNQKRNGTFPRTVLAYLGIAVVFEPLYLIAQGIFYSVHPNSVTYDRLGFLTWLPMPLASLALSVRGLVLANQSCNRLVKVAAIMLVCIFGFQALWYFSNFHIS